MCPLFFCVHVRHLFHHQAADSAPFYIKIPVHSSPGFRWKGIRFFDPIAIVSFGMYRIMMNPHIIPDFIQQLAIFLY
jgi:hypothetical protein